MFLLFFNLMLGLTSGLNLSFSINISVSSLFGLLLLHLASCRIGILSSFSPTYKSCSSIFGLLIPEGYNYLFFSNKLMLTICWFLSVHLFLFCFYVWSYILYVQIYSGSSAKISSIMIHVFCNLFKKICPLFGKVLFTCWKCSRASFLPSTCGEKMHL